MLSESWSNPEYFKARYYDQKRYTVYFRCRDGYVKVYINGQEEEHHYDKHDYMFCGKNLLKLEQAVNISK